MNEMSSSDMISVKNLGMPVESRTDGIGVYPEYFNRAFTCLNSNLSYRTTQK